MPSQITNPVAMAIMRMIWKDFRQIFQKIDLTIFKQLKERMNIAWVQEQWKTTHLMNLTFSGCQVMKSHTYGSELTLWWTFSINSFEKLTWCTGHRKKFQRCQGYGDVSLET